MKERERVLDLVKKGILSSEEALVLLENLATEKDEKQIKKAADEVDVTTTNVDSKESDQVADLLDELESEKETVEDEKSAADSFEEQTKASIEADRKNLEKILDELATKANQASVELDEVNAEIAGIKEEIKETQEALMELNTKEELGELSEEDLKIRADLEEELKKLEDSLADSSQEKIALEAELKNIRKEQWTETKDRVTSKFDIPDDWKEQATDTINQVGEKMSEAGSQLGSFLKKTFSTVAETVNENVEWKDINFRVPGVATTKFDHEFNYPAVEASLIDVKVANGNVVFKTWDQDDVKVEGKIKLYGKMDGDTPLEAFLERSQIDVDDEVISFQIPNKRVRADLVFYLPARTYDHVSVKLLNGNITVEELKAKDVYTKSTNGSITFNDINATMLEVEGVNGDIKVLKGEILDNIIETVNGTVTVAATPQTIAISLINGDIRITVKENTLKKIEASSVNGNVKIALPLMLGIEGTVKTSLGSINSRLSDYEVIRKKKERTNQLLQFRRVSDEQMAQINASTTTGNIYLKDTDK
ncbi:daptomycin-sensing surface protein LiaX [Enterococcus sp. BWB1-3]|uniref:daptomycin-sensing surface protein LiaX n=1 Tax=unclassified Enterococcus TaxID=2608891 RepID=UPI00192399AB|nr:MULTISPECIES: daptomycin-sensing surface protein LiaX [unclassified Enterococcus]MBL1229218.1 daptomycin-sensing surface protein LiaX [Enterococcus sp. BWB1-3]MCB5951707.1 daptomycin-sensing surface protein LiaX [Enterococcus sp. BWT-B8]MCB5955810.1 daptomycin-sensing surface protein LiaX [Enterococcus sp. CWB-B31]